MINAHTHLYSGLAAFGLPEPSPRPATFLEVLQRFWWRLDCALDTDMLRAAARFYVADARRRGTAFLVDHHESPNMIEGSLDILADACHELGMPALLCYGVTERNGGRLEAERGLAECQRFIRDNRRPVVRGLVGLHASFTVSDDTIRAAGELCREMQTAMHLHIAEAPCDVADARSRGYDGIVSRLESLGALPSGSILAHGVHLATTEVSRLQSLGCWLVQNPRSNARNQVGYPAALGCSALVALGTDGFPSDMEEEAAEGRRTAAAHGESAGFIDRRLDAGRQLFESWFPMYQGETVPPALNWDGIRAEAEEQARRLAGRMRSVGSRQ